MAERRAPNRTGTLAMWGPRNPTPIPSKLSCKRRSDLCEGIGRDIRVRYDEDVGAHASGHLSQEFVMPRAGLQFGGDIWMPLVVLLSTFLDILGALMRWARGTRR